jgi:hypothetical protein
MRRTVVLAGMLVFETVTVALSLLFYLTARPTIARAFDDYGTPVPAFAAVALSSWFLPATAGASVALAVAATSLPAKPSRRGSLLRGAIVVGAFGLVFAVAASFVAVFQGAG